MAVNYCSCTHPSHSSGCGHGPDVGSVCPCFYESLPYPWSRLSCSKCDKTLGVVGHVVSSIYCSLECAQAAQVGKRPLRDNPKAIF